MLVKYIKDIENESALNIGQTYVVLCISLNEEGQTHYVIKRSLKHYCFGFFLADCFEIVSSKIPDCWIFTKNKNEIDILPAKWNFDEFWLQYSDYDPEVYNMAEKEVKKMILTELPMDEFNRALKPRSYGEWNYIDELEYILEMITEARDHRFIKHILEVAKWFESYTFNQINEYTYKQELEVFENVYRYLSIFKENLDVENYFIKCLVNGDEKFSDIINNYLKK